MNRLVSIVTLTYNHQDYISPCVYSVLSQTYGNWEQIIIDDGSTDKTAQIIAAYSDPRIRYHRQSNQGPFALAKSYNKALSLARGSLIAILEGDDYWPVDKLATLIKAFEDETVVLAYGEREDVDSRGRKQRRKTDTARLRERLPESILSNSPIGVTTRYMLLEEGRSLVHPCTVILRRNALERIGGFQEVPELPLTDYPTFLKLSLLGRFFFTHQTMGFLRRHGRSITVCHARTIHDCVSRFATDFVREHSETLNISPAEWAAVESNWQEAADRLHFSEARMLLLNGRWPEARSHFLQASNSKRTKVRAASLAGCLFSFLHMDIELLMRLGGRADLRTTK